jgi:short-subunit dehydrogenase
MKIVIFGATSAIAQAAARLWAARGDELFLVGRNAERLSAVAKDLEVRGKKPIGTASADLTDRTRHAALIEKAAGHLKGIDTVLIAHGELGDQKKSEADPAAALAVIDSNFLSCVSLLTLLSPQFERQRSGTLAVISSVAGDRGRRSNYIYGAAKAGLNAFLSGLRARLSSAGVSVLTIKPGFVDTPMTAQFKKGLLWASADSVGKGIVRAVDRRRDVIYLPRFWCLIMSIIRAIPERIFKRLKI